MSCSSSSARRNADPDVPQITGCSRPDGRPLWPYSPTVDLNLAREEAYDLRLDRIPEVRSTVARWWTKEPCEAYGFGRVQEHFAVLTVQLPWSPSGGRTTGRNCWYTTRWGGRGHARGPGRPTRTTKTIDTATLYLHSVAVAVVIVVPVGRPGVRTGEPWAADRGRRAGERTVGPL